MPVGYCALRPWWEHLIRDDSDFQAHLNYIHYNPVKHGWVKQVKDLPKGHKGHTQPFHVGLSPRRAQ
jgi:hypothetical protein